MAHPQVLVHRRGPRTRVLMLDHRCPDFKFPLWHRLAPCLVSHQNNVVLSLVIRCIHSKLTLISGGSRGEARPKGLKKYFLETGPPSPLSQGLDDCPPPPPPAPPCLKVWICHCLCYDNNITVFNLF